MIKIMVLLRLSVLFTCVFGDAIGSYNLYESIGSALYDFSGNRYHAEVSWADGSSPVLTDRGQYFYANSQINFPSNMYKLYPANTSMCVFMWFLPTSGGRLLRVSKLDSNQITHCNIDWTNDNGKAKVTFSGPGGSTYYTTNIVFCNINVANWNFLAFEFTQVSSNTEAKVYNMQGNSLETSHTFTGFNLGGSGTMWGIKRSYAGELEGFFYSVLWQFIKINLTIDIPITVTIPPIPPQLDPYKSYNNLICDTTCTNNRRSCSLSSSGCINFCDIHCEFGCYRIPTTTPAFCINPIVRYCLTYTSANTCSECMVTFTLNSSSCSCTSTQVMLTETSISKCVAQIENCMKYNYFTEKCTKCNSGYYLSCSPAPCTNYYCVLECDGGYYKNSIIDPPSCSVCSSGCRSCTDANTCTSCISTKLKLGSCVDSCGEGYYNNAAEVCVECPSNCKNCSEGASNALCTTCNSGYFLNDGSCIQDCAIGYYKENTSSICIQCPDVCESCSYSSSLVCTACSDGYYLKNGSCTQDCGIEYYGNNATRSCEPCQNTCTDCSLNPCTGCPSTCSTCTSVNSCSSCINNASIPQSGQICLCNLGYTFKSGECIEAFSAYATMKPDGTLTLTFSDNLTSDPLSNLLTFRSDYLTFDSNTFTISTITPRKVYTISFTRILLTGNNTMRIYFPTGSHTIKSANSEALATEYLDIDLSPATTITSNCSSIPKCSACSYNGDSFICDSCLSTYCLNTNPSISCETCNDDEYGKCPELCSRCDSSSCRECIENAVLEEGKCKCVSGYTESSGKCIDSLIAFAELKNEQIRLYFNKELKSELKADDLNIEIDGELYTSDHFILIAEGDSNQTYLISLESIDTSISTSIKIQFTNQNSIIGQDGSTLSQVSISVTMNNDTQDEADSSSSGNTSETTIYSQSDYLAQDPRAEELASQGSIVTVIIITVSAAMSLHRTEGFWYLINTIQLISMIPLLNIELPTILFAVLTSTRSYNPLPNIVNYKMPLAGPRPFRRASLLGLETPQFFMNIGNLVLAFFITLGILPLLFIIRRCLPDRYRGKFIDNKVNQMIQDYRWNVFTRFYIESYIEIAVAASLQLVTMKEISDYSEVHLIANMIGAIVIMISVIIFPILLSIFIHKNHTKVNDLEFIKKWGSLFEEIDVNKGLYSAKFYYVHFLIRRLALVCCFFLLKDMSLIQMITASGFCWIKFYIVARYRPFIERPANIVNILVELCIASCYTLVILFGLDIGKTSREIVELTIIGFIMLGFTTNISYIVYNFISFIIQIVRKKKTNQTAKTNVTVLPENEEFNRDSIVNLDLSMTQLTILKEENPFYNRLKKRNRLQDSMA